MNMEQYYLGENEKPLDRIPEDGGFAGIFRKIVVVGDSLSSGEFESVISEHTIDYHDCYEHAWGAYLGRLLGSEVLTFSRGGMTAMEYCESYASSMGYWKKEDAADAYILALGVNDIINYHHPIGSAEDVRKDWQENRQSFIGYYAQIIQRYKEISPKARFFLMTAPKSCGLTEEEQKRKENLAHAVRELSSCFEHTFLLDFYEFAPYYDEKFHDAFFMGSHMAPQGYLLTAKMVAAYMDFLIRKEPEAFKEVGFIRTPWAHDERNKYSFPIR